MQRFDKDFKTIILLIVWVSSINLTETFSQKKLNSDIGDSLYFLAKNLRLQGSLDSSKFYYNQSIETFKLDSDWLNIIYSISGLAQIADLKDSTEYFMDYLERIKEEVPESNELAIARLTSIQGRRLMVLKQYTTAIDYFKSVLEIFEKYQDITYLNNALNNTSICYSRLGDQKNAIEFILMALKFSKGKLRNKRCKQYSFLGKYYFHNTNYFKAEKVYQEGIETCSSYGAFYYYIIELYLNEHKLIKAKEYLDKAKELFGEDDIEYLINLSEYYRNINEEPNSIKYYSTALMKLSTSVDKRSYIKELVRFAQMRDYFGDDEESFAYADTALITALPEMDSLMKVGKLTANSFPIEIWLVEALYLKAKYYSDKYYRLNAAKEYRDSAKFHYDLMYDLFERVKSTFNSNSSIYRLTAHGRDMYHNSIRFYLDLYGNESSEEFKDYAFELSQESNAYVLKNAFSLRESLGFAGVPVDSINKYIHLHSQVSNDRTDTIDRLEKLKMYDDYKSFIEKEYPSILNYKGEDTPTIRDIQERLKDSQLLIKYFYHEGDLKIFAIDKNESEVFEYELEEDLDSLVNEHLELLRSSTEVNYSKSTEESYISSSKKLYEILLGEVLNFSKFEGTTHLIIVPDGPVKKVSFSSLINKPATNWEDITNYLVNDYEISYLYYCAELMNVDEGRRIESYLGIGVEYDEEYLGRFSEEYYTTSDSTTEMALRPLKYAADEIERCASIYSGDYYLNGEVTPDNIESKISEYDMVHFSLHALVDEDNYLNSYMLLHEDATGDNRLTYREILSLNNQPDFVILSACQTGVGKEVLGEGSMSLCRAFSQTGTSSTMGSYWNTPDRSTMQLMEMFYANLKRGRSKSESLRLAQISYCTNDELTSPMVRRPGNWASWVIYGSVEPIANSFFVETKIWSWLLILLVCSSTIFLIRKNKQNNVSDISR